MSNLLQDTKPIAGIQVMKYISVDSGITWIMADIPPGPSISQDITPKFKYIVTNIGNNTLTNITLFDNVFGQITTPTNILNSEQSFEVIIAKAWKPGQHQNVAIATGTFEGKDYIDTAVANYCGLEPSIQIIKYVSVDNGATWIDANSPPGPLLPSNIKPKFKYVVNNKGNTLLKNISVEDNILGLIGTIPTLAANESYEFIML